MTDDTTTRLKQIAEWSELADSEWNGKYDDRWIEVTAARESLPGHVGFLLSLVAEQQREIDRLRCTGWISIKDRLPAQDGYKGHVIVARTVPYDPQFGERDVTMGYLSLDGWKNDHGPIDKYGEVITDWMPFPEPPPIDDEIPPMTHDVAEQGKT